MATKFAVSPMVQKIELKPGTIFTGSITVSNPADATEDFYYKVSLSSYNEATPGRSMITEWTRLDTEKGILKPNEKNKINFVINVPENAPAGGQYLAIGVASDLQAAGISDGTVGNIYEMNSLVFANVDGETIHDGEILMNTVPDFVSNGVPKTKVELSNKGNIHETAITTITVKNIFNGQDVVDTTDGKNSFETVVMPDSTKTVERDIDELPALGIFEVKQSVSYLGNESFASSIMVICPIWFIVLVIATICSIIAMIFYGAHLRKKKQARFSDDDEKD